VIVPKSVGIEGKVYARIPLSKADEATSASESGVDGILSSEPVMSEVVSQIWLALGSALNPEPLMKMLAPPA
jgi:hypothetical protein